MRNLGGRLLGGVYLPGEVRFLIPNREDSGVIGTGRSDGAVHREEGRKRTGLIQIEIQTGDSSKRSSIGLLYYPRFKAHGLGSSRIPCRIRVYMGKWEIVKYAREMAIYRKSDYTGNPLKRRGMGKRFGV